MNRLKIWIGNQLGLPVVGLQWGFLLHVRIGRMTPSGVMASINGGVCILNPKGIVVNNIHSKWAPLNEVAAEWYSRGPA